MRTKLDNLIRAGGVAVAAVSQRSLGCDQRRAVRGTEWGRVWAYGEKRPVAILVRLEEATLAFGIDGAPMALDELERRFPGKRAEFERIVRMSPDGRR